MAHVLLTLFPVDDDVSPNIQRRYSGDRFETDRQDSPRKAAKKLAHREKVRDFTIGRGVGVWNSGRVQNSKFSFGFSQRPSDREVGHARRQMSQTGAQMCNGSSLFVDCYMKLIRREHWLIDLLW